MRNSTGILAITFFAVVLLVCTECASMHFSLTEASLIDKNTADYYQSQKGVFPK